MEARKEDRIVIIGMGYLMEYIAPCYQKLLGDKVSTHMLAVTVDREDLERKQEVTGVPIILDDNAGALRKMTPSLIFFAPPPSLAQDLTEEVLVPYYQELRATEQPLPTLYAFPPNPEVHYYQYKLGEDVKVANILPNMISEIEGRNVAEAGFSMVTLPDKQKGWDQDGLSFLEGFWAPLGQVIYLNSDEVKLSLAVSCANQMLIEVFIDVASVLASKDDQVSVSHLAEAARAYHLDKQAYSPPASLDSQQDVVDGELLAAIKKITFHAYAGTISFLFEKGFPEKLAHTIQKINFDMNLRKAQLMELADLRRATRQHATSGGVLECACIAYTQLWHKNVVDHFSDYPTWTPDAAWALELEKGFFDISEGVFQHLANLANKPEQKNCQIEHHAVLYALLVKHAMEMAGEEGRAAMSKATAEYGFERGGRMRQRALAQGDVPNALSHMAYGEWSAEPGLMVVEEQKDRDEFVSHVLLCEWCQNWKKHGLLEWGKVYCENVDVSIAHGFDKNFDLAINSLLSQGDDHCEFGYGFVMDEEKRETLRIMQERLGKSAQRDFNYHVAHLFYTSRRLLMEELGATIGKEVADAAMFDFVRRFGSDYARAISVYEDTDFSVV